MAIDEEKAYTAFKYLLYILTVLSVVFGVALLVIGALLIAKFQAYLGNMDNEFIAIPILCIAFGAIIFVVGILGFCGALKENKILLIGFIVTAIICIIVLIILVVYLGQYKNSSGVGNAENIEHTLGYPTASMANLQQSLKCCGRNGPTDYITIPPSCCTNNDYCSPKEDDLFKVGCDKKVKDALRDYMKVLHPITIVMLVIEVVTVGIAGGVLYFVMMLVLSDLSDSDDEEKEKEKPPPARGKRQARGAKNTRGARRAKR